MPEEFDNGGFREKHAEHYNAAIINYYEFGRCILHLQNNPKYTTLVHKHTLECSYQHQTFMFGCIIFCATTLESYINFFSSLYSIDKKDIKRRTVDKYKSYFPLVKGISLQNTTITTIEKIFWTRNKIVHAKVVEEIIPRTIKMFGHIHAAFLINSVNSIFKEIKENIDPKLNIDWLKKDLEPAWEFDFDVEI